MVRLFATLGRFILFISSFFFFFSTAAADSESNIFSFLILFLLFKFSDKENDKCQNDLSFDVCLNLGKCTETPCEVCQQMTEKAATLASEEGSFKGLSPVLQHFEHICKDASNPEIAANLLHAETLASKHDHFLKKYQHDKRAGKKTLDFSKTTKPNMFENLHDKCHDIGDLTKARAALKQVALKWGEAGLTDPKKVRKFCGKIGFCRPKEPTKVTSSCRVPEEHKNADGTIHEGADESWTKHDVARTMAYKYEAKVTQTGQQTTKHAAKTDKAEEEKDTWVMADVVVRQSGKNIRGMARFEVMASTVQVGTYDTNGKFRTESVDR